MLLVAGGEREGLQQCAASDPLGHRNQEAGIRCGYPAFVGLPAQLPGKEQTQTKKARLDRQLSNQFTSGY
jgi:hypothetical protein